MAALGLAQLAPNAATVMAGVPGFFEPNPQTWRGVHAQVGIEQAAFYGTDPLRHTWRNLVDFDHADASGTRLTVGAVNANTAPCATSTAGSSGYGWNM